MARRRLPACLTPEETARLIGWKPVGPIQTRNLAILRLMVNAGLRSREVLTLRLEQVDWDSGQVRVVGKGGRERAVWLNEEDLGLLKAWLAYRLDWVTPGNDPGTVFLSRHGTPMGSRNLRKMVKGVAITRGIARDVHPHMLRHTFATDLLRKTKNLRLTQKALGHADISTTTIYTHIVDDELEAAMKSLRARAEG